MPEPLGQVDARGPGGDLRATAACARCGQCCRTSSPTLHPADAGLFENGVLAYRDVYTIRGGEYAFDTIRGRVIRVETETIKVREAAGARRCVHLGHGDAGCGIYETRPLQCRTLECWNPDPLVRLFANEPKLTRRELVEDGELRELMAVHDERVSFHDFGLRVDAHSRGEGEAGAVLEILNYDLHFRHVVADRWALEPDALSFYFGRPMIECLAGFGYTLEEDGRGGYVLVAGG